MYSRTFRLLFYPPCPTRYVTSCHSMFTVPVQCLSVSTVQRWKEGRWLIDPKRRVTIPLRLNRLQKCINIGRWTKKIASLVSQCLLSKCFYVCLMIVVDDDVLLVVILSIDVVCSFLICWAYLWRYLVPSLLAPSFICLTLSSFNTINHQSSPNITIYTPQHGELKQQHSPELTGIESTSIDLSAWGLWSVFWSHGV